MHDCQVDLFIKIYFLIAFVDDMHIEEVISCEKLNDTEPLDVVFALSNTSMTLFVAFPRIDATIRGCTRRVTARWFAINFFTVNPVQRD